MIVINVTILILIDGFLQCKKTIIKKDINTVTILILIDGFLQLVICISPKGTYKKSQSLF